MLDYQISPAKSNAMKNKVTRQVPTDPVPRPEFFTASIALIALYAIGIITTVHLAGDVEYGVNLALACVLGLPVTRMPPRSITYTDNCSLP